MIPSLSVMEGIVGAVASLAGVNRCRGYENDTGSTNADGITAHTIALVVEGGTTSAIAEAIAAKKTPGTKTQGTTSYTTYDQYGIANIINFYRPTTATISIEVSLTALTGYVSSTGDAIKAALKAYMDTLLIGDDVLITKLYTPANLDNNALTNTYNVTQIRIKKNAGSFGTSNITLAFNEIAQTALTDITLVVV